MLKNEFIRTIAGSAIALLGIDWHVSNSIALRGGYRWLDYDLDKDDASVEEKLDISMSGPFLGVGFQW